MARHHEIFTAVDFQHGDAAGIAIESLVYEGAVPVREQNRAWRARIVGVPSNQALVEVATAIRALTLVPRGEPCRLYLNDKRVLQILFGPPDSAARWDVPEELRTALRRSVAERLVDFDLVGYRETPRLDRMASRAHDSGRDGHSPVDIRFEDYLSLALRSAAAGGRPDSRPLS